MGDLVGTYLETGAMPFSEAKRNLQLRVMEETGYDKLRSAQQLRVAEALRLLEVQHSVAQVEASVVGGRAPAERELDQLSQFLVDHIRHGLMFEPFAGKRKLDWFDKKVEITKEMIRDDPELKQSEYYPRMKKKYMEAVKWYAETKKVYERRKREWRPGDPELQPSLLTQEEHIRQQFDPRRVNHAMLIMPGALRVFGYGNLSLDDPVAREVVAEYGENIMAVIYREEPFVKENLWVPSISYLRAKEYFGPEKFAQLQQRVTELNVALTVRKVAGKGEYDGGGDPEDVKSVREEELRMVYAAGKLALIFLEGDEFINNEVVNRLWGQLMQDYDFGIEGFEKYRKRYFMGQEFSRKLEEVGLPVLSVGA